MDESKGSGWKGLKEDEIVAHLTREGGGANLVGLFGYLGKSPHQGSWRLYTTLRLDEYFEIAESDIVYSQSLATTNHPLAGTKVWVRQGSTLQVTKTESIQAQGEFLRGSILGGLVGEVESSMGAAAAEVQLRGTRRCLTWGCCRWGFAAEDGVEERQSETAESQAMGIFLSEALATGDATVAKNHRTHRVLTLGCCGTRGVSRSACSLST